MTIPRLGRAGRARWALRTGVLAIAAATIALLLVAAAPAHAETAWWQIGTEVAPTHLPPQEGGEPGAGQVTVTVSNLGDRQINGGGETPVLVTDKLPPGLVAIGIKPNTEPEHQPAPKCAPPPTVQCTYTGVLNPYERVEFKIGVRVELEQPAGTTSTVPDEVSVQGGGAPSASSVQQLTISDRPTPFGVASTGYELAPWSENGTPTAEAGSHPFQLTTNLTLNQVVRNGFRQPAALPKDLRFDLPPGLIGNPDAVEQCTPVEFTATVKVTDLCPPRSVVGAATVVVNEPQLPGQIRTFTVPVFNLVPGQGEPARFGFEVLARFFVAIDTAVRSGGDYGVVASVEDAPETAGLLSSQVTLWGDPGDPRHDQARGWECIQGGYHFLNGEVSTPCPVEPGLPQTPFLTLPTSCAASPASDPVVSSVQAESWTVPGFTEAVSSVWSGPLGEPLGLEGCGGLPFTPSVEVAPEEHTASTPSPERAVTTAPPG